MIWRASRARKLVAAFARLVAVVILGVVACAALVRYSPGFDSEETDLDARISQSTAAAIRGRNAGEADFLPFLGRYAKAISHGDLGVSRVFNLPVTELLRERAGETAALMASGIALAWVAGLALAFLAAWQRNRALRVSAEAIGGITLAIPPAVVAVAFFAVRAPLSAAMALAILPRIFGTLREILEELWRSPALICARARGVLPLDIALNHVAGPIAPHVGALAGVSLVTAFGAAIPIETLCDIPGIGQLAWRAALGRDLPLLCALAMLVTFTVALAQGASEVFGGSISGDQSEERSGERA